MGNNRWRPNGVTSGGRLEQSYARFWELTPTLCAQPAPLRLPRFCNAEAAQCLQASTLPRSEKLPEKLRKRLSRSAAAWCRNISSCTAWAWQAEACRSGVRASQHPECHGMGLPWPEAAAVFAAGFASHASQAGDAHEAAPCSVEAISAAQLQASHSQPELVVFQFSSPAQLQDRVVVDGRQELQTRRGRHTNT